ncbi:MAG: AAA family ATPase [Acidimicrobiales bacterium]|nr:AAA family ATPase [Acidimicrobiales bacterium]
MARILLAGAMGSGKSTVGRDLAGELGWELWDNDAELITHTGHDVQWIAEHWGAERLHDLEATVLRVGLAAAGDRVICVPGSAVLDGELRELLKEEWVVWLRASVPTLVERLSGEPLPRPFVLERTRDELTRIVADLDAERRPGLQEVADLVLDVDSCTAADVATRIKEAWASATKR